MNGAVILLAEVKYLKKDLRGGDEYVFFCDVYKSVFLPP
jgi:hypothetical protein